MNRLVLSLVIIAFATAGMVKMASDATLNQKMAVHATKNQSQIVEGVLHMALPNKLKYFPVEHLVPLP